MKKTCLLLMCMVALCGNAQQSYPEELLTYDETSAITVSFKGKAPGICDFITSLFPEDDCLFFMDSGDFIDAWFHYLNNEKQEENSEIIVDKKNGYVYQASEYDDEEEGESHHLTSFYEMCYWNCADGEHKLFAMTCNSMENGRYVEGQTTGMALHLYDNARHVMWDIPEADLGAEVDPGTDECYEYNAETKLYYVRDRETGEPLTLTDEEFYRWLDERPVVVYRLPKQGKDIIAEIHRSNRTDTVKLVWNGMRFDRE